MDAVLFDLDGTLMDTSESVLDSFYYVSNMLKYPDISRKEVKAMIGTPVQKWFEKFYNANPQEAQYATNLFREHNLKYATTKASVYPGVYDLLDELSNRDIKVAVATYKREDCALSMLDYFGISKYCSAIHGADNYNKLKKADVIDICLKELAVNRKKVVLVGDTVHDAQGAMNAGIHFIGVTYGMGFRNSKEIAEYPHLGIVDNIIDVLTLL